MIAKTKEEGLEEVKRLVDKFELNENQYKNESYNEEQLKTEFLNPFFKALGWDVNNQEDFAPQYKEVVFEDSIKVGNKTKAPDYAFRLGGQRIFFLEAKKPSRDIKNDKDHAFQVRRYGWSAKLKGSVLSDFEELAIYETQTKPESKQNAGVGRLKYYKYDEYIEKWDEIWDLLSKEAVMKGKFDKFFTANEKAKGTSTVDEEFLKEINEWRELLAKNIALRNEGLSISELNYAVQLIIDRIIFFRMAEDRGIQKYKTLYNLLDKDEIYKSFADLCKQADAKYNSGLFHFSKESKDDVTVDNFTLDLNIDNSVFKTIFKNLYYPNSPYEFSMISPEILGNIYEQFLGKTITLTKGHRAKIIEKPEVKKAGGVYYTPNFIVKYIVENTVGELLKGKTPNKVSNIKILDPACGSGSFLLEAYQYLLDWHLDYYRNLEKPPKNTIFQAKNGEYYLTIQEKKRILLNNIYGVDLDVNAVEVTKLSLLLKVLENQNKDVLEAQQKLFQERVLPNLSNNIKCGNSLLESNIIIEEGYEEKIIEINPFDWKEEFSTIFANNGFDVVIGNPPYVNAKLLVEKQSLQRDLISKDKNYECLYQKWDLYIPFMEKGIKLLNSEGIFGMIIPYPFVNQNYAKKLREYISNNYRINQIVDLSSEKIFKNVTIENCIPIISKTKPINVVPIYGLKNNEIKFKCEKDLKSLISNSNSHMWDLECRKKINKDFSHLKTLGEYCYISKGMVLNADEKKSKGQFVKADLISEEPSEIYVKPYVEGKNIDRYKIDKVRYLEWNTKRVPKKISRPTFPELYSNEKILVNKLGLIKATFGYSELYCNDSIRLCVSWKDLKDVDNKSIQKYLKSLNISSREELEKNSKTVDLKYLLAIINSKLGNYFLNLIRGFQNMNIYPNYLKAIPIQEASKNKQNEIVDLVDKMIGLNKELSICKTPNNSKLIQKQIRVIDNKLNKMIYDLYGLNEDEIKIVEENIK